MLHVVRVFFSRQTTMELNLYAQVSAKGFGMK